MMGFAPLNPSYGPNSATAITGMVATIRRKTHSAGENYGNDQAVLVTPQKNGNGPFTMPETFFRQA
jgi:hypothetical protein